MVKRVSHHLPTAWVGKVGDAVAALLEHHLPLLDTLISNVIDGAGFIGIIVIGDRHIRSLGIIPGRHDRLADAHMLRRPETVRPRGGGADHRHSGIGPHLFVPVAGADRTFCVGNQRLCKGYLIDRDGKSGRGRRIGGANEI